MTDTPGERLRQLVAESTIQIPGAPSALAGRLVERMGFDAVYLSGASLSSNVLALPDVGLLTLTELTQQLTYLSRSVEIPIIVDADTGFGDVVNVERTVVELEAAGAAAIQLEDQQLPKKCGHLSGKALVEPRAMVAKIHAAVNARSDDSTVIIARTDARGVTGMADAIARAHRYLEAGADWIFPEALTSREEFEAFAREVDAPLIANMTEFGKGPLLTIHELAELGYSAVLYPVTLQRVAMKAMETALAVLGSDGTQHELLDLMQTRDELYDLLEYRQFEQRDEAYFSGEEPT
ncbi:methylisocitrate lyase [Pirellula staleyi DSM 6068]|uniref:Methylisocitrate lyase n=1 Tax=Pirellula staleyi (strain ATCC 27377 / DSM 6068 / ICPB 4128) TaxID=530564 RepID=D2QWM0_PIRSD|nr:methylisocitrate lyase [Pirellula staleyi]ADB17823.1 methylisocitrate lyase [Pirellula staleyi DSM 6068]